MATAVKPSWFRRYLFWNYRRYTALRFKLGRKVTQRGTYLLGAFTVAGTLVLDTNRSLAFQGFAVICMLVVVALLTRRIGRVEFEANRVVPPFGTVGQPLPYQLNIKNLTGCPQASLKVYDDLSDPRPSLMEFVSTPEPGEEKRNRFDRYYGYYRWI